MSDKNIQSQVDALTGTPSVYGTFQATYYNGTVRIDREGEDVNIHIDEQTFSVGDLEELARLLTATAAHLREHGA